VYEKLVQGNSFREQDTTTYESCIDGRIRKRGKKVNVVKFNWISHRGFVG
jgi:hypothetical protein